jgi:hypothetical protein
MSEYYKITITITKPDDPAIKWLGEHPELSQKNDDFFKWCKARPGHVRYTETWISPNVFQRCHYFIDKQSADEWREARKSYEIDQVRKQYLVDNGFTQEVVEGIVDEELPELPPKV